MSGGRSSEISSSLEQGWWPFECELLAPNLLHHILKMTHHYLELILDTNGSWLLLHLSILCTSFKVHCGWPWKTKGQFLHFSHWTSIGVAYSCPFTIVFKHSLPSRQKALDSRNRLHLPKISKLSEDQLLPSQGPSNYSGISDNTISSQDYVCRSRGS